MKIFSVLSHLGLVLEIFGIFLLIPNIVAWIFGENVFLPFFISAVMSFIAGILLDKRFEREELDLPSAMVLSTITFILISLLGSIPYLPYALPIDAVFESFSGFTTTGLSVLFPEKLPRALVFWRSFTQWIGGIGILIIFLLLLSSPGISSYYIYESERGASKVEMSVYTSVKRIFLIYTSYTLVGILLLFLLGMPFFDSIITMFSTISTGGFSATSKSIYYYNNMLIELVLIIFMVLGATSFFIHNKLLSKKFRYYIKSPETKIFWSLLLIFSILLTISFLHSPEPMRHGIFHAFSALTTTGFKNSGAGYSDMGKLFLIMLMIIGGYAGSTAGGLKLIRVGILSKSLLWLVKKSSLPLSAVVRVKFDGNVVEDSELTLVATFSFIYLLILLLSTIVISSLGYAPLDSFFISASAEGTVGLSTIDIANMHAIGKVILIIDMLFGRLEIIPVLVFIRYLFMRRSIL
ncbi:MAG TPA: TrkH family potassium uptake protein [Candidatus Aenigmarchaeota archaeon]|nr:MAG: hypothetical protein DRP03_00920 [Candidatus Aenigmarchaeota archaeon]HDD46096.1 TrkH family potassium uptake protein [Candidatus Aenigmarchaeota archaeon]